MSKQTDLINIPDAITVSGSNVGIGTSSPSRNLTVSSSGQTDLAIIAASGSSAQLCFGDGDDDNVGQIEYSHPTDSMRFYTQGAEQMRISSSGNVGIGTTNGDVTNDGSAARTYVGIIGTGNRGRLNIGSTASNGADSGTLAFTNGTNTLADITVDTNSGVQNAGKMYISSTDSIRCSTAGSERMRIDSSGNLLVGKTALDNNTVGIRMNATGDASFVADGNRPLVLNRKTSDGDIALFLKDGSNIGSIKGYGASELSIGANHLNGSGLYLSSGNNILPMKDGGLSDNTQDFGKPSIRWDDIYATNGSIQTSDFNEKQDIASLTATEMLVGKRISALFKTFRWKDSVAEKGDNARTHTGVIAQDVQAAFTAEGLDAGDYALFISSTWWETQTEVPAVEAVEAVEAVTETTTDEDGNEVVTVITEAVEAVEAKDAYTRTDTYDTEAEAPEGATEKTRMGIRYPELLSFVAAYNEQRFASIEARLTALEA